MRLIADNAPDLIWAKDMDDRFIFVNRAMCNKLIMCDNPDEAVGKRHKFFADRERKAGYEHTFEETSVNSDTIVKEKKSPLRFTEDGFVRDKYIILDVHKSPFLNEEGEMLGTVGCGRDVTREKEAEEKSKKQTAVLEAINRVFLEALTCESDEDVARTCLSLAEELTNSKFGFIGEVNQTGHFDTIALSNPGWKTCKIPDSNAVEMIRNMAVRGIWGRVIKSEQSLIANHPDSHPASVGTPDDHPAVTSFLGVPLKQADKIIGMIALANKEAGYDLADQETIETLSVAFAEALNRKRSELALKESEEKYRSLVESTEDNIYLIDKNLKYLFVNEKYQTRFDLPVDKIIGSKYEKFHRNKETKDFTEKVQKIFETGQSLSYEHQSGKDGKYFIRTLSPVKNQSGETISVTVISKEITKKKQADEALKQANKKLLKESNQRRFLSNRLIDLLEKDREEIAMELHDHLGQMLTSIKLDLEIIDDAFKPEDKNLKNHLNAVKNKAVSIIKDIKSISQGLKPSMLDNLGLLPSLRELLDNILSQTKLKIEFFTRDAPGRFAYNKELAIYRILQEALTNIIKHAKAKNVFVNLVKKDKVISLSVEDDGVGFDIDKAMEPSNAKGTLGLLIMRERAEQFDGEFTLESKQGKGSHILVEIPL